MTADAGETLTTLLSAHHRGDRQAFNRLAEIVYADLHRIARAQLVFQRPAPAAITPRSLPPVSMMNSVQAPPIAPLVGGMPSVYGPAGAGAGTPAPRRNSTARSAASRHAPASPARCRAAAPASH